MSAFNHFDHPASRMAVIIAAYVFFAVALDGREVVAQGTSLSAPPDQLAAAIARTMTATTPAPSATAPITQQFSSRGNVVESRTVFKDASNFANAAARRRDLQEIRTRYMCKAERLAYIRKGVIFHDVMVGPDPARSFDFTIDEPACASLATPAAVDTATLQGLARDVARQLTAALPKEQFVGGSRFDTLMVQGELIRVTYLMNVPAFAGYYKQRGFEVRGKTQGWFCSKFNNAIRQGTRVRFTYRLEDGSSLLEFPIDTSVC